jgi:hypothetical protein
MRMGGAREAWDGFWGRLRARLLGALAGPGRAGSAEDAGRYRQRAGVSRRGLLGVRARPGSAASRPEGRAGPGPG